MNIADLAKPTVAQTLDQAIAAASLWTVTARPIVKAIFEIDDAAIGITKERLADPFGYVSYMKMSPAARDWQEAQNIISKAKLALEDMLPGIRDSFLCDERRSTPLDASDDECDAIEEFNDELELSVLSVDAFVKQMEREQ